jgi:hypothetical protein
MKNPRGFFIILFSVFILFAYNNCAKNGFENAIPLNGSSNFLSESLSQPLPIVGNEPNVVKITVGCGYINEPCVSVTICQPGTTTCQTIPNVLLDTGSYGLRLFSSVVTLNLTSKTIAGGTMAECVSYADGSSQWGPVKSADVVLGQRRASNMPIHIVDAAFGTIPTDCTKPDSDPKAAGYNGILGVGVFTDDCGAGCAVNANNRVYFTCSGATCTSTTVPLDQQVANPVPFFPTDNNGVALQFPAISSGGATALSGWLVLGIGTQDNNIPSGVNTFPADTNGYFQTIFNGKTYSSSFIDSGSNGLFFPGTGLLPACDATGGAFGFFCPSSLTNFTAVQAGKNGSPMVNVNFQVMNAQQALATTNPNIIFNNLGGSFPNSFDWGLPFYIGRTVFSGIDGKSSSLGTGPYFAW